MNEQRFFLFVLALCLHCLVATNVSATTVSAFSSMSVSAWRKAISDTTTPLVGAKAIEAVDVLVEKLSGIDPDTRDALAYETIAFWLHGKHAPDTATMIHLFNKLLPQITIGLGAMEDDRTFQRSFTTLALKEVVAADLTRRFLNAEQIASAVTRSVTSLQKETDLRGHVPSKGWAHARAHQADLVRILARHTLLTDVQHQELLDALLAVVERNNAAWRWGEDARIAAAITWLLQRESGSAISHRTVETWAERVLKIQREFWAGSYNDETYLRLRAQISVMTHLATRISHPTSKPHTNATAKKLIEAVQRLQ